MGRSPSGPMPAAPNWAVKTDERRIEKADGYLVTEMSGHAGDPFIRELEAQVFPKLRSPDLVDWIADASRVGSFDTKTLIQNATQFLVDFKKKGGRIVVAIITFAPIRMAATTISWASAAANGPRIHIVTSMPLALLELQKLRNEVLAQQRKAGRT